jgi:hypothetical protein
MDGENAGSKKRTKRAVYENDAARARAWRQRQKDLIAAASKPAEPVIVEKIVEKVVERIVDRPVSVPAPEKKARIPKSEPSADRLLPILKERFAGSRGEESAKRFRTNAAKAATTAREVLSLISYGHGQIPEAEREFLQTSAAFFDRLNGMFQTAQAGAKRAAAKAEAEYKAKHEAKLREAVAATFGPGPDSVAVLAVAAKLLEFDKVADGWLKEKRHVARGYVFLPRDYELRNAVQRQDAAKAAREVAEARIEIGERGRRWRDDDGEEKYAAGWADFEEYRTNGTR